MLAENAERTRTAPISSAIARSALPRTWSSMFTIPSRSGQPQCGTIPNPHPPGGQPDGGAGEVEPLRAPQLDGRTGRQIDLGAGNDVRSPHCDELDLPPAIRVAVPFLVCLMEPLGQVGPELHRQLERLSPVAEVGLALRRKLPCLP